MNPGLLSILVSQINERNQIVSLTQQQAKEEHEK